MNLIKLLVAAALWLVLIGICSQLTTFQNFCVVLLTCGCYATLHSFTELKGNFDLS